MIGPSVIGDFLSDGEEGVFLSHGDLGVVLVGFLGIVAGTRFGGGEGSLVGCGDVRIISTLLLSGSSGLNSPDPPSATPAVDLRDLG